MDHICCPSLFSAQVKRLSNNKQPGQDGVQNELLTHLPDEVHRAIHRLFILMWATGTTPRSWKQSSTILLHRKGGELELSNYRPIALANTLYKLWTIVVHASMSKYAEYYDILSSQQEGFRKQRNTIRQLQNMMNMLSDAKISNQDIMLYIDFSSAFNTIDHDKLLCIMHDLGFTQDAIQVIANLYTDATTKVRLPYTETEPVSIYRGSIQGDTLSPFLCLVFIEPLPRWMQSGGRGYKYGCLESSKHAKHTTSALAYAEDLAAATSSLADLQKQAMKIEAFTTWSGMTVNCSKCAVTGVAWGEAEKRSESALCKGSIEMMKRRAASEQIRGTAIPFYHPDKEPYKYLGVLMTPTMNWVHNMNSVMKETQVRADSLSSNMLTSRQKMKVQVSNNEAYIIYSFPLGLLTEADMANFDGMNSRLCKNFHGLPVSTPTAMVFEDKNKAGMGLTSLEVKYAQLITKNLVLAVNNKGALGFITRAMLKLQDSIIGSALKDSNGKAGAKATAAYHLAKQLTIIKDAGVHVKTPAGETDFQGESLSDIIGNLRYDPKDLGLNCRIPL